MFHTIKSIIVVFAVLLSFSACTDTKAKKDEANKKSMQLKENDVAVKEAIKEAQKGITGFYDLFEKQDPKNYNYSVKMAFKDFKQTEHIWLDNLKYENGTLYGFVANSPKHVPHIKNGDKIPIEGDKIVDWMYLRNDYLQGGYTIKAIRANMSAEQKKAFDAKIGFKIKD